MTHIALILAGIRPLICDEISIKTAICFNLILCLTLFILLIIRKRIGIKPRIFILSFSLAFLLFFTQFFSINIYNSQMYLLKLCLYGAIFVFILMLEEKDVRFLLLAIIGIEALISMRGIYQYFIGIPYIADNFSRAEITSNGFYALELLRQKRVVSYFLSPNLLASYLIMLCPVVGGYIVRCIRKKAIKPLIIFTCILLLLCTALLLTKTIGAYLSLTLAVLFFIMAMFGKNRIKVNIKILILVFLVFILFSSMFLPRANHFLNLKHPQNSIIQRLYYWKSSISMIKEHFWFGVGAGNFGIAYPKYKNVNANEAAYAHNSYLQIWAESGIFTLIFFIIFIGYIFKKILLQKNDPVTLGLLTGSFAFLVHNLIDYSFFIPQVAFMWWVITACALNLSKASGIDIVSKEEQKDDRILGLVYGGMILILFCNNFIAYKTVSKLEQAKRFYDSQKYTEAISSVNESVVFSSQNDFAYYFLAHIYRRKEGNKFSHLAVDNYKTAISLNPHYAFYYYELGEYFMRHGKFKQAQSFFKQALKFYPTNNTFLSRLEDISST